MHGAPAQCLKALLACDEAKYSPKNPQTSKDMQAKLPPLSVTSKSSIVPPILSVIRNSSILLVEISGGVVRWV